MSNNPARDCRFFFALEDECPLLHYEGSDDISVALISAFYGERGRGICRSLLKHVPVVPLGLTDYQPKPRWALTVAIGDEKKDNRGL
jgi:hypothetical protein